MTKFSLGKIICGKNFRPRCAWAKGENFLQVKISGYTVYNISCTVGTSHKHINVVISSHARVLYLMKALLFLGYMLHEVCAEAILDNT